MRNSYDILPEYLIVGGFVLIALNRDYLQSEGKQTPALAYEHWFREVEEPNTLREQVVLISRVLPASVNSGYTGLSNFVVHLLNEKPVRSLRHLMKLIDSLPLDTQYLVFESEWDSLPVVLDYQQCRKEHQEILRLYGIHEDRHFYPETVNEG